MLKFSHSRWRGGGGGGGILLLISDLQALITFSFLIDKVSFKTNSMSLGLVFFEEKLFKRTHMQTPQSDAIMSADITIPSHFETMQ